MSAQSHRSQSATFVGLDLTGTGAPRAWSGQGDAESESFIMGRLAGLASLADKGGIDLLALDARFRLGSGRRRDDWLDGALAASRLGRHTSRLTVAASIPLGVTDTGHVANAVASIHKATGGRAAWQVEGGASSARAVDGVISALSAPRVSRRTGSEGAGAAPQVVVDVRSKLDLELAAARADVARIRATSLAEAVAARTAIREAASEWGRNADDVRVVVDVHVVLGADEEGAQARADLVALLEPEGVPTADRLSFVGTVEGLADLWANWVEAGAADGFTLVPASVPTDVLAVVTELVPELARRGLRGTVAPSATPAPAARARRNRTRVAVSA